MVKLPRPQGALEVSKYYICCNPYPNDLNDPDDYITFARWIVSILGCTIPLCAIYYKLRTSDKVIFAVNAAYSAPEKLLGEHRWNEFLKKPKSDEVGLKSQIFNCAYDTDNDLKKDGWQRISVENYFFINWRIGKWLTKVPYPAPHRCPLPAEITEKPLYRPAVRVFLGSRTSPVPSVGSSDDSEAPNRVGRENARFDISLQKPTPGSGIQKANAQYIQPVGPAPQGKKFILDDELSNDGPTAIRSKSRVASGSSAQRAPASVPQVRFAPANPSKYARNRTENLGRTRATTPVPTYTGAGQSQRSRSSSPSSEETGGSTTVSMVSSAPSSPAPAFSVPDQELVDLDVNEYENNYDEEVTEETCYGSWEITIPTPYQPPAPVMHSGNSAKLNRHEHTHSLAEPVHETKPATLWVNSKPVKRPTGIVTAMEAKVKEDNKALCPIHKGGCKKTCRAYKKMLRSQNRQEKGARKGLKSEEEWGKKEGRKKDLGLKMEGDGEEKDKMEGDEKEVGKNEGAKNEGAKNEGAKNEGEGKKMEGEKNEGEKQRAGLKNEGKKRAGSMNEGENKGDEPKDTRKVADENTTTANDANNKRAKEDIDITNEGNGQEKPRPWDEYTSDEDDIDDVLNLPMLGSKSGARKFYDDDVFFN